MKRTFVMLIVWFSAGSFWIASGHICGPGNITLNVGQTCPWRITADRTEVETIYSPTLTGNTDAVRIHPTTSGSFSSHHGDFTITGLKPGTAKLSVHLSCRLAWSLAIISALEQLVYL